MSLRLVYGRMGSGKTSLCIREAISCGRPVFFITPEQFTFTAEKRICALTNIHGLSGVEVLSFKRLAQRALSTRAGAALPKLDARTRAIILQKLLMDNAGDLTALSGLVKEQGAAGALGKLLCEMKRYSVTPEALRKAASHLPHVAPKLRDLALLQEAFDDAIRERFSEQEEEIPRLAALLQHENVFAGREIYFDRFDGFDASEFAVIGALLRQNVRVTVTICCLPEEENIPAFILHAKMAKRLLTIARENGAEIEPSVILRRERPAEEALQYLERAYFAYPTKPYADEPKGLRLVTAPNPLEEVHYAARRILELCRERGYLFRDIAIAVRNTAAYERYMEAVLPAYGIPFFMDRTIHILEHPLTVFVLSALEIITKGCSYESMFRYIKSGFLHFQTDTIDTLENYVLATGIRGDIWKSEEKWNLKLCAYAEKESEEDAKIACLADATRRRIMEPILNLQSALKTGKTAVEKCKALYAFVESMRVPRRVKALCKLFEKRGDYAASAEYKGVFNDFIGALDGVCDAFGDEPISTKRLYEVLRTAFGEAETGVIPASQDGVSVGGVDRIKGYAVRALLVLGTQDGVFPAPAESGGILNSYDRAVLSEFGMELATNAATAHFEEEHLIYKCLTIPSELLEFSYPAANMEGSAQRSSRIFQRVQAVFPKVEHKNLLLEDAEEEKISVPSQTLQHVLYALLKGEASDTMLEAYGWLLENMPEETSAATKSLSYKNKTVSLSKKTIAAFLGEAISTSVSRLEKLAACPFAYYATYMLGATERRVMQPGSADAGRFLHDFLDMFSKRLVENGRTWKTVDNSYIDDECKEIFPILDRRLSPFMLEHSPRYAHLFIRLQDAVRKGVNVLASHMKKSVFEPMGYELSFSENGDLKPLVITLPNGKKVKLTGRIDRADVLKTGGGSFVRILDYKSGAKRFELDDVFWGLNLQLAVYISAMCTPENAPIVGENPKPAGMLYFQLSDPVLDASPADDTAVLEKMRAQKFKLKGLLVNDETILKAMDANLGATSDILPVQIHSSGIRGSVATGPQFEVLDAYVKKTVKRLLSELESGCVNISPYKKGNETACTYCRYAAFCAHNGHTYREIQTQKPEKIWQAMEKEV